MDTNTTIKADPDFPSMEGTVEEAAMVVAGMDNNGQHRVGSVPAVAAAAAAAVAAPAPPPPQQQQQTSGTTTAVTATQEYQQPTFCSDDPAAAALAVTEGAAMVGRIAAEMSGDFVKRKRLCRFPGCTKVIKSQGHCQRHGAKAKRCKVDGCEKQAQGTHEGMCKRHWRAVNFPDNPPPVSTLMGPKPMKSAVAGPANGAPATAFASAAESKKPPPVEGTSVYESILPSSIAYRPTAITVFNPATTSPAASATAKPTAAVAGVGAAADGKKPAAGSEGATTTTYAGIMPLVAHLREGASKHPVGWHRNAERRARGLWPVSSLSTQLEPWERQLALVEILLLSGGTPNANFKDLAHAWGREKGFHNVLANSVCQRGGATDRKRRSDAGKALTSEQKSAYAAKAKQTKLIKKEQQEQQGQPIPDAVLATATGTAVAPAPPVAATGTQFFQVQAGQQPQQQQQQQMDLAPTSNVPPTHDGAS